MKQMIPLALLAAMHGAPAQALDDQIGQTVVVRYADLDLSSAAGRATLESRARHAVRRACDLGERRQGVEIADANACEKTAWKEATRQIEIATASVPGGPSKRYSR